MLGIRHINGVAIDLWVGHPHLFDCDRLINEESDAQAFEKAFEAWQRKDLSSIQHGGTRHLAIVPSLTIEAQDFLMDVLRNYPSFQRITIILPNVIRHETFLKALETVFPEE